MKFAFKPVLMAALLAAGVVSGSHAMAADDGLARIKASDRNEEDLVKLMAEREDFKYATDIAPENLAELKEKFGNLRKKQRQSPTMLTPASKKQT